MSEAHKKLKDEEKHLPRWHKRYEPLGGMSNIERQVEEARKKEQRLKAEEQRLKAEFKKELRRQADSILGVLKREIADEEYDAESYKVIAERYSMFPSVNRIFLGLAADEAGHARKLRELKSSLEFELNKELVK